MCPQHSAPPIATPSSSTDTTARCGGRRPFESPRPDPAAPAAYPARVPDSIVLTGHDLTLEAVEAVARHGASAVLAPDARARMARSRSVIEAIVERGEAVYGVTTGFGDLAMVRIAPADAARLQENLLVSHAVGVGAAFDVATVRAMLLLRANTLARGQSGCRPELVERLLAFLTLGIHPVVPEQGSVGASGDLAPLAHLALPLIGRGSVMGEDGEVAAAEALAAAGLEPLRLEAKEGLALLNGTQMMSAVGALAILDAERLCAHRLGGRGDEHRGAARHRCGLR